MMIEVYTDLRNSRVQNTGQDPQGHSGEYFRKDGRHLQRIPQDLLRFSSSRSAGLAREPERILDVHAQLSQVASFQGWQ